MKTKKLFIEALTKLSLGQDIEDFDYGICHNLHVLIYDSNNSSYRLVQKLCLDWDGFSGDACYPIKENLDVFGKWQGDNMIKRNSLCLHLIKKIKALSKEDFSEYR